MWSHAWCKSGVSFDGSYSVLNVYCHYSYTMKLFNHANRMQNENVISWSYLPITIHNSNKEDYNSAPKKINSCRQFKYQARMAYIYGICAYVFNFWWVVMDWTRRKLCGIAWILALEKPTRCTLHVPIWLLYVLYRRPYGLNCTNQVKCNDAI